MSVFYKMLVSVVFLMSLGACSSKDTVPTTPAQDTLDDLVGEEVVGMSSFVGVGGHVSSGQVRLIFSEANQTYSLIMENFNSSNGPDLKVYLSADSGISNFTNLGSLKSTSGTLRYDFPASQYKPNFDTVLIWCQQFGVLFGKAEL